VNGPAMYSDPDDVAALHRFQRMRRILLAVLLAVVVAGLCLVQASWSQGTHDLIESVGLSVIVVGILGRMWCTLYIGGRKSAEVVTSGPYSVCRNPLYFFSSVAAAGVGAQTGSILLSIVFFLGCAIAFTIVIRREEAFLSREFGAPYQEYLETVPRFWPNPLLFKDDRELLVRPDRIYTTLGDGAVFFVAKPLMELVEYLQDSGVIPVLLHLY
jgi:protein-S-isoprenylcysteine O-methyltransferase Ste14